MVLFWANAILFFTEKPKLEEIGPYFFEWDLNVFSCYDLISGKFALNFAIISLKLENGKRNSIYTMTKKRTHLATTIEISMYFDQIWVAPVWLVMKSSWCPIQVNDSERKQCTNSNKIAQFFNINIFAVIMGMYLATNIDKQPMLPLIDR